MARIIMNPGSPSEKIIELPQGGLVLGRAADCDICLMSTSVSTRHARIECKPDGVYLVDLNSTNGVTVNDKEIAFQRLRDNDRFKLGEVPFCFYEDELIEPVAEEAEATLVVEETGMVLTSRQPSSALVQQQVMPPGFPPGLQPTQCMRCGAPLLPGARICAYCGMLVGMMPQMPMPMMGPDYVAPVQGRQGVGVLPIIALLAALTLVGFPIALVLGLISLNIIRRQGGTRHDMAMAGWAVGLGLACMLFVIAGGSYAYWRGQAENRALAAREIIEENEGKVIRALKNLACAQKFAHSIEFLDNDADGSGEYLDLQKLAACNSTFFDPELADGKAYGYRFNVRTATEGGFLATAEPAHYGRTGRNTLEIDQKGQIRGIDGQGKSYGRIKAALPVLQGEKNAFADEIDDEIAKDVVNHVKRLDHNGADSDKAYRILSRLKEDYALTKTGQQLLGHLNTVEQFILEKRTAALYDEARNAVRSNNLEVALAKFNEITETYAGFSKIADVEKSIAEIAARITMQAEERASQMFKQAETLEREGKPEEAHTLYQKIESLYAATDTAKRVSELKQNLQGQILDNKADGLFASLMDLSPEEHYEQLLNIAAQLHRNYAETDIYKQQKATIEKQERKAKANRWRFMTQDDLKAGHPRVALAKLEAATKDNPDLQYDLQPLFMELYRAVGKELIEEEDWREALAINEKLIKATPSDDRQEGASAKTMAMLYRQVGLADFEKKDYAKARQHLENAAWKYTRDATLHLNLGAAYLYGGQYENAGRMLDKAVALDPRSCRTLLYRAYLNMRYVLFLERSMAEQLQSKTQVKTGGKQKGDKKPENKDKPDKPVQDEGVAFAALDIPEWDFGEGQQYADHRVPDPRDVELHWEYDYEKSAALLPTLIEMIQVLYESTINYRDELNQARGKGARSVEKVKVRQALEIANYRKQVSQLRTLHLEDIEARKQFVNMLCEMETRMKRALQDMDQAARIRSTLRMSIGNLLTDGAEKWEHLHRGVRAIDKMMTDEGKLQDRAVTFMEEVLQELRTDHTSMSIPRLLQNLVFNTQNLGTVDEALIDLRKALQTSIDIEDLLLAAEGDVTTGGD